MIIVIGRHVWARGNMAQIISDAGKAMLAAKQVAVKTHIPVPMVERLAVEISRFTNLDDVKRRCREIMDEYC